MDKIENIVAKVIVNITWFFTFFIPIDNNKVTFISYYSNNLKGDFKLISNKLKERGKYKQVFLLKKFNNRLIDKFFYLFDFIIQTYHINTSKIVIIDANNFVISNCKKKSETKVIQIWHACGAIKKFGYDANRRYKIKNYDYVIVAGKEWIEPFSSAFRIDKDKILPIGVAKTDNLFNKDKLKKYKKQMLKEYPQIKGKKIVLYAPTFRGDGVFNIEYVNINLQKIQQGIGKEYIILYKLHPSLIDISLTNDNRIINVSNKNIYKAFSVADILISDYSAVTFDFSILEKPMLFYTPDLQQYKEERGFYYDYENFIPGPICYNEENIIEVIKNNAFNMDKVKNIKEKFFDYKDGKSTSRIVDYIEKLIKGDLLK